MKKSIKNIALSLGVIFGFGSCSDFFDVLPLNDIVLESFYTEENDISSVLNSCYAGLESADCISRMAIYGEIRSDNISAGSGTQNEETEILKENIQTTTKYANWACFYTVINRCNTVMYYAPIVNQKDPNYTISEMRSNIAEAKAIRALCYFYLVRAFRDVPFVTEPSIDDNQDFVVPATSESEIINFLVADLETIKEDAMRKFPDEKTTTTRFTRNGIYALLADMYLWKGDYSNCIKYCDKIMDNKKAQYIELFTLNGNNIDIELFHDYPLISEHQSTGSATSGNAATKIFGEKYSFESLFELNFEQDQPVQNTFINNYYGGSSSTSGYFSATPFLVENVATGANKVFKNTDCRYLAYSAKNGTMYSIRKYVNAMVQFNTPYSTNTTDPVVSSSSRQGNYANWIIYRLTDIMLMKAEAEIQLGKSKLKDGDDTKVVMDPYYQSAFKLVSAVYGRANNYTKLTSDTLKFGDYSGSVTNMEALVLIERQRELMFEGKRWFDLLRMARREGNNDKLIEHVIKKQKSNTSAIKIKLSSMDGLYWPYSENELKINTKLVQNPAYNTDKLTTKSE